MNAIYNQIFLKVDQLGIFIENNLMIFSYKKTAQNIDLAVIDFDGMLW